MKDEKTSVQSQFSKNPEKYRDETLFAAGDDLQAMLHAVSLTGNEKVLDIGTGAGHTAITFSPYVKECVGLDLTEKMLQVAADYAKERNAYNVSFCQGDAEHIPFPDEMFDIVTCRYAAHHFPNVQQAVQEISRVLKKDGHFLLIDHYAPEDEELDHFVNTLNKMRDPSQVRESSLSEWQAMFAKNELMYNEVVTWNLPLQYASWIERAGTSAKVQKNIKSHIENAAPACRETFNFTFDDEGNPYSFCLKAILLHGRKAGKSKTFA